MDKILAVFKTKRNLVAALAICLLLLISALVLATSVGQGSIAAMSSLSADTASLTVHVVEGYTETPIEGAKVVVVETGNVYETDKDGMTDTIDVPLIRDTRYDDILPKPWGEVTLIIYKEGFMPYALFYLQVLDDQTREGVKILLFENGILDSDEPFSIIEGPSRVWVNELIQMYEP